MRHDDQRLRALLGHDLPRGGAGRRPSRPGLVRHLGLALAALLLAGVVWRLAAPEGVPPGADTTGGGSPQRATPWGDPRLGAGGDELPLPHAPVPATTAAAQPDGGAGIFRVDGNGRLVLDEQARLGVERLVALHDASDLERALQQHLAALSPQAASQARRLVEQYASYVDAQKLSYAPGAAPLVPQQGLAELDGLIALRSSYFGESAARAMFGAEEAVARRLLELMRDDPRPNASMSDKAERAQVRLNEEIAQGSFRVGGGA